MANKKTVTIEAAGKDQGVLLATTRTKKQSKPASLLNKSVMKKEFNRMAKAVTNQVLLFRTLICYYVLTVIELFLTLDVLVMLLVTSRI